MDPQATLDLLFENFENGEPTLDNFRDLFEWLNKGGALPTCQKLPKDKSGYQMAVMSAAEPKHEYIYSLREQEFGGITFERCGRGKILNSFDLNWE